MAIDPELLEILACPECKVSVTLNRQGTGLLCGRCLRLYPIVDDIPVMIVEEAVRVKKAGPALRRPLRLGKKAAAGNKRKPAARKKSKPKAKVKSKPRARRRP